MVFLNFNCPKRMLYTVQFFLNLTQFSSAQDFLRIHRDSSTLDEFGTESQGFARSCMNL